MIPFVAKVMESCAKSRVFKPPNPWTMAIMNVLAELHKEPEMKLHLKFEIEVLCNKLEINLEVSTNILIIIINLSSYIQEPSGWKTLTI